ncbi:hypothetical protein KDC22_18195 [Paenibacillus tritici]|uniref:hypothetical protein n=1 Tax=Paenibacillus tritici TaxID=1873425 RepID=UPI001BAB3483|nr:hypothetical protein [Paenibacillus tritici]QUL52391.1 hypothetical protein KDC22_18195 [Paenibacillus tritici]
MGKLKQRLEQSGLSLFVSLPANDVRLAKAAIEEGADALKVHFNVGHRASGTHFGPLESYEDVFSQIRSTFDGPFGVVPSGSLEGVSEEEFMRLAPLGFDFYSIYAHHLPSCMLGDHGLDRTFAINDTYDLSQVQEGKRFGFTALEASIVPGNEYGTGLSFADLLKYRYLADHSGLPVLVPSQRKLVEGDVPSLQLAGVKAIMLGAVVTGTTEEQLRRAVSSFRSAIDRLS